MEEKPKTETLRMFRAGTRTPTPSLQYICINMKIWPSQGDSTAGTFLFVVSKI
jgi:hypothetical protein